MSNHARMHTDADMAGEETASAVRGSEREGEVEGEVARDGWDATLEGGAVVEEEVVAVAEAVEEGKAAFANTCFRGMPYVASTESSGLLVR